MLQMRAGTRKTASKRWRVANESATMKDRERVYAAWTSWVGSVQHLCHTSMVVFLSRTDGSIGGSCGCTAQIARVSDHGGSKQAKTCCNGSSFHVLPIMMTFWWFGLQSVWKSLVGVAWLRGGARAHGDVSCCGRLVGGAASRLQLFILVR